MPSAGGMPHRVPAEDAMNAIVRTGVDLVKNVMQIHAVDSAGHVVIRKAVARANASGSMPTASAISSMA